MQKTVKLLYSPISPYSERVLLTLLEKKVPFDKLLIDIKDKSQEFKDIYSKAYARNPESSGKVPVLIHGDLILAESDLISWFIAEEYSTGTQLIPEGSFDRLRMRRFIQHTMDKVNSAMFIFKGFHLKSKEEQTAITDKVHAVLAELEDSIQGPFVLG
jgi:glutathione S-transferase